MKKIEFIALRQVELEVPGMEGLRQVPINRPEDISFIVEPILGNLDREMLLVLGLNTKNKVNMVSVCSIGTVNSSVSSVREVFKALLLSNCLSFIVVHNHPSGDTLSIV